MASSGFLYELHSEPVQPLYGIHIKASQSLFEALTRHPGKEVVGTLQWEGPRGNNVIIAGQGAASQTFKATCYPEEKPCHVVLMPKDFLRGAAGVAGELARIGAKLAIAPTLNEQTSQKYAKAGAEAKAKQHERQTKVVDMHSKAGVKAHARGVKVRQPTPPAPYRAPTPTNPSSTAAFSQSTAPAALRGPAPGGPPAVAVAPARAPTPPPSAFASANAAAAAAVAGGSGNKSKGASQGGRSRTPPPASARGVTPPPGSKQSLPPGITIHWAMRKCAGEGALTKLVAMLLYQGPLGLQRLETALAAVYQAQNLSVPRKDKIQSSLTTVANLRSPGIYYLRPEVAQDLKQEAGTWEGSDDGPGPGPSNGAAVQQSSGQHGAGPSGRDNSGAAVNGKVSKKRKSTPDLQNGPLGSGVLKRSNTPPVSQLDAATKAAKKAKSQKARSHEDGTSGAAPAAESPVSHQRPPIPPGGLGYRDLSAPSKPPAMGFRDLSGSEPKPLPTQIPRSAPGQRRVQLENLSDDDDDDLPKATKRSPTRVRHKGAYYALEPEPLEGLDPGPAGAPSAPRYSQSGGHPSTAGWPGAGEQHHGDRPGHRSGGPEGDRRVQGGSPRGHPAVLAHADHVHPGLYGGNGVHRGAAAKYSNGSSDDGGAGAPFGPPGAASRDLAAPGVGSMARQRSLQSGSTAALSADGGTAGHNGTLVNGMSPRPTAQVQPRLAAQPPPVDQGELQAFDSPVDLPGAAGEEPGPQQAIESRAQFALCREEYAELHEAYTRVQAKLAAFRNLLQKLHEDANAASAEQDRVAWLKAYADIWERRAERAHKLDTALKRLHTRLCSLRQRMQEFAAPRLKAAVS